MNKNEYACNMLNKKSLVLASLFLIFGLINVSAFSISFVSPMPANATSTTSTSVEINISITNASNLDAFIWNWNNVNYTFYDGSLVLMLNLDNVSAIGENATYAADVSRQGNNATLMNGTLFSCTEARYGCALSFDGIDDYASFPDSLTIINTSRSAYTLEAWFRARGLSASNYVFEAAGAGPSYFGLRADNLTLKFLYGNASSYTLYDSGVNLSTSTWYYANVVLDPGAGSNNIQIYLNGNLISQFNDTRRFDLQNTKIGSNWNGGSLWNGTIDELRLWNRSLSASEIQQHYYSNFYKYASDKWAFYTNQQNLAAGAYTFRGFIRDIIGNLNQTEIRTIIIASITEATSSAGKKCSNECLAGERRCAGKNSYDSCGDYDADSCLEWSETKYCASGMACSGGSCKPACSESWVCGEWGACGNGKKERACTDANNCGTENNMPEETLNCLGAAQPVMLPLADSLWIILLALIIAVAIVFSLLLSRKAKRERKRKKVLAYRAM
ncbi:MAG TPA: LamG domain-containing protein [Candidatus Nanoarchaeia archaeon]|nr:LamG domain-containing protein [Candidatus Nanoarchaeia archaeon]